MDDSRSWERYGALGGILFVILVIVSIAISGSVPKASDSTAKILKYFRDNKDGIEVAAFVGGLATVPILWWAGSLWARMRRAENGQPRLALIAVLGLVLGGAGQLVASALTATVALQLDGVGASAAKFFFVLSLGAGAAGSIGIAVLVLATSALSFRTRVFPVWLAWVGAIDAVLFLVSSYAIASTSDASTKWCPAWVAWAQYRAFWEQHLRWAMRPSGNANIRVTTVEEGERTRLIIDATDATGERLGERGREFGTVTGRKRRCGWFDAVLVRQTCTTGGVTGIALTKLDVLDGFEELKICVGYELDGQRLDHLPTAAARQARVTPIYETLPGWPETTAGARSWAELPAQAIKYVRRIEELIGCPVALLSTSPERDDTILVTDPFAA